jgi:hypothetical protein
VDRNQQQFYLLNARLPDDEEEKLLQLVGAPP